MPLLDLDKINLNKTVIGINCPACGGELQPTSAGRLPAVRWSLWRFLPRMPRRMHHYRCRACRRSYGLSEVED